MPRLRGLIDKLASGSGLRRGRRHPYELLPDKAVNLWRVESVVPNRQLRLRAEMETPANFKARAIAGCVQHR